MSWNIIFFKNSRGEEIVKDDIRSFEKATISKIGQVIKFGKGGFKLAQIKTKKNK